MVFADFFGVIRRRWYAVGVGLIVTIGLANIAVLASPPTYTSRGLVLLVPSKEAVGNGGNPLLVMEGLALPASIVVAYYKGTAAQAEVAAVAPSSTFEVSIDESVRGPVLAIDVTDPTAAGAIAALDYIAESVPRHLNRLQEEVQAPSQSVVTSMPLTMDTEATADTSTTSRLLILAVGVGLIATMLLTSALDGLLLRRRRARAEPGVTPPRLRAAETDAGADRISPEIRRTAR